MTTFVYFFYYCWGFTGYFFAGWTISAGLSACVFVEDFFSDVSYLESFLLRDALTSMVSDVFTFFYGEGSFWAANLARFPLGETVGETFFGYVFLEDDLRPTLSMYKN